MTRYYFDVHHGDLCYQDVEGLDLISVEHAWDEAAGFIADKVKDVFIKGAYCETHQPINVKVREGDGVLISLQVCFATNGG